MNSKAIRVIAVVAVAGAIGSVAVNALAEDSSDPAASKPPTPTVATSLEDGLSVFREERTAADALPVAAIRQFPAVDHAGLNPDLARRALASGGDTLFLVPAEDRVCAALVAQDGTAWTTCTYAEAVANGENGPAVAVEGKVVTLVSVVPDGVSEADVTLASGETRTVPVENNALIARLDSSDGPRDLSYTGPDGPVSFSVTVPDLAAITAREQRAVAHPDSH